MFTAAITRTLINEILRNNFFKYLSKIIQNNIRTFMTRFYYWNTKNITLKSLFIKRLLNKQLEYESNTYFLLIKLFWWIIYWNIRFYYWNTKNEMKSLLSLEGLRPPLSRDSSTYTHAMSYFAWFFNRRRYFRCWCMTLLTGSLLVFVAHHSLPGDTGGHSPWCCWCLLGVTIRCCSLRSWSSVLLPLSWRRRPIWCQVCRGVSVPDLWIYNNNYIWIAVRAPHWLSGNHACTITTRSCIPINFLDTL